jgi:hypothetical protein
VSLIFLSVPTVTDGILLGYRQSSLPFSYRNKRQQPIGYAIDLCREVVEDASTGSMGWTSRLSSFRSPLLIAWRNCGRAPSILNAVRPRAMSNVRREVAFSPIFFVAGTKLMVPKSSEVQSYRDLGGPLAAFPLKLSRRMKRGWTRGAQFDRGEQHDWRILGSAEELRTRCSRRVRREPSRLKIAVFAIMAAVTVVAVTVNAGISNIGSDAKAGMKATVEGNRHVHDPREFDKARHG